MYLMLKDTAVAQIDYATRLFKVLRMDLMPFSLRHDNADLFSFSMWLSGRVLSLSRSNAKKIISAMHLNQNNRLEMCFACKGVSLTDAYWLSIGDNKDIWASVNLFDNSLSTIIAHIALTGEFVSVQGKVATPELTGNGSYAKCWRRYNSKLYLYKAGTAYNKYTEPLIEVLCSDILDCLDVEHVQYQIGESSGKVVSRCECIANQNVGIVPAQEVWDYFNSKNDLFLSWCCKQEDFLKMLIVDYIISNVDRHTNNWGFFMDNSTGKLLGFHPLFDHNIALSPQSNIESKIFDGKTLEDCARYAKKKCSLNMSELKHWLKRNGAKRFRRVFGGTVEYKALLERIRKYESW